MINLFKNISDYLSGKKEAVIASNKPDRFFNRMTKEEAVNFMVSLIRQQRSLYKKEIKNWIAARQQAMNIQLPRRKLLYELYSDIETDAFIHGQVWNQRILRISNKSFKVVGFSTGEEDPVKTDLLRRQWFSAFIKLAMESRFWGHSLMYISEIDGAKGEITGVRLVYREHVVPEKSMILKNISDTQGVNYTLPPYDKWVIGAGDPESFGLYEKAAPLYILKKHSWANWDEFEEMFGIPIRWAKTASTDKKAQAEIITWLEEMGSGGFGLFPEGTEFEIRESTRSDAFQVFNQKRIACNEELAILINGQTMTSLDGSSRSQAEVHQATHEEIIEDDKKFIAHLVNDKLMPLLSLHGYPFTENDVFQWNDAKELSAKEKLEIYKGVNEMGFQLDQKDVENTFGVKIAGIKQPISPFQPPAAEPATNQFFPPSGGAGGGLLPYRNAIEQLYSTAHPGTFRMAASDQEELDKAADRIIKDIFEGKLAAGDLDKDLLKLVAKKLSEALFEGYGKTFDDIDFNTPDFKMLENLEKNLYHFSAAKNYQQLKDMNAQLRDAEGKLRSFSDFKEKASEVAKIYNTAWLETEYNMAVAASQTASRWVDIQDTKDTLPLLRYQTAGDERVRQAHRALDGIVKPADDPFWNTYYPPNGWGCRCDILQLSQGKESDTSKTALPEIPAMFRTNMAKTGMLFPSGHPYYEMPQKDLKRITTQADKLLPERGKKK